MNDKIVNPPETILANFTANNIDSILSFCSEIISLSTKKNYWSLWRDMQDKSSCFETFK